MKKLSFLLAMVFAASFAMAQNNDATIKQYGSNIGEITQNGADNDATIKQGTNITPVTNNHAPTYAGDWKEGSFINQIGDENVASTTVTDNHNSTSIYQNGDVNNAIQNIGTYYSRTTDPNLAVTIDQIGDGNHASQNTIKSFGTYGIQDMKIYQEGAANNADQISIGGMQTHLKISQIGDNNNNSTVNTFDLSSTGLDNPLTSLIYKFNNGYGVSVSGMPMTQYSNQNKGKAIMNVDGDNNNTYQYQEYTLWSTSGANEATLDLTGNKNDVAQGQLGEKNTSDVIMDGDDNVVSTSQDGDLNTAKIDITGNLNVAGIQQTGNSNDASVLQVGNSNFAKVIQQP